MLGVSGACGDGVRDLTLVLPYFCNVGMLREQARIWSDYPAEVKPKLHVIVIDDCSPKADRLSRKTVPPPGIGSYRGYRITKKVRWNWLACRNLGVAEASTEWVLLTDIDHALPYETLEALTTMSLDRTSVYRIARVDAPHPWPYRLDQCPVREDKRYHPNTWLMTRAMYDAIGGYDERLSGCYGTDGEFRDRVREHARTVIQLSEVMVRYPREVIADASTTIYTRKNDICNDEDLIRRRELRAKIQDWRPVRGSFPWECVF